MSQAKLNKAELLFGISFAVAILCVISVFVFSIVGRHETVYATDDGRNLVIYSSGIGSIWTTSLDGKSLEMIPNHVDDYRPIVYISIGVMVVAIGLAYFSDNIFPE